eukprot:1160786-Pelagomonas_calceolata.AAC.7
MDVKASLSDPDSRPGRRGVMLMASRANSASFPARKVGTTSNFMLHTDSQQRAQNMIHAHFMYTHC